MNYQGKDYEILESDNDNIRLTDGDEIIEVAESELEDE